MTGFNKTGWVGSHKAMTAINSMSFYGMGTMKHRTFLSHDAPEEGYLEITYRLFTDLLVTLWSCV